MHTNGFELSLFRLTENRLYRGWLPTDMDAFFNFSLFVLFIKTKQTFQNQAGLSIPV